MRQITEIINSANQKLVVIGEEGQEITLELSYKPTQQAWYFNLSYENTTISGQKLLLSPNALRQWSNIFNFGLFVKSTDFLDPFDIDDFINNRVSVYLLNNKEIELVEDFYNNV